jgi:hypothetical protein
LLLRFGRYSLSINTVPRFAQSRHCPRRRAIDSTRIPCIAGCINEQRRTVPLRQVQGFGVYCLQVEQQSLEALCNAGITADRLIECHLLHNTKPEPGEASCS